MLCKRQCGRGGEGLSYSLELGPGERWFVARVLAHQENRAQFNRLGFQSFVPRLRRTVRHARRLRDTPPTPFSRLTSVSNGTFGVASLITDAEQPRAVPSGVVEALVASTDNSGTVQFDRDLEIGQKVRILSGPFVETICQLVHLDDRGRVRVLLQFMGVEVAAQLHQSCVVRAA